MNDNQPCMFFLKPVASPECFVMSRPIPITELAAYIVAEQRDAQFGPFDLEQYSPAQQVALLSMRFNDPVAQAILLRVKHSTVAGMDFAGLRDLGLAVRKLDARYHRFTPRGQWVSAQVRHALAIKFDIPTTVTTTASVYVTRSGQKVYSTKERWA